MPDKKEEEETPAGPADDDDDDDSDEPSSDDEGDDDLILEGVIVRNPDVSDSDDTSSEEDDDEDDEEEDEINPPPNKKARPSNSSNQKGSVAMTSSNNTNTSSNPKKRKKKTKKPKDAGPEIINVDFTFCDMEERYFYGLKTLLTAASPLLGAQSSALSDLMIENISVGTITSTEGDTDGTVFGFASVLNVSTYQDKACIQALKTTCLEQCPAAHKKELETVLSGKTKRPAGFYIHGRMVNLPLEIVQVLHEQLVLDMDWAVEHAHGGKDVRKALDFGAFVLLTPSYRASGVSYFKLFDDEIFANHAEFTYEMELPKPYGVEETPYCTVVVLTKTGHRAAMKSLDELVGGQNAR